MREAEIWMLGRFAGRLTENEDGFFFAYDPAYIADAAPAVTVSLTGC